MYIGRIREAIVGGWVGPQSWQNLMKLLADSDNQSNLLSALLFAGNFGFLAIQALQEAPSVLSTISALFSLTSLLIGMQHARQHANLMKTTAFDGGPYFGRAEESWLSYRGLALHYALPTALLVWAIVTLVVSLLFWVFQNVTSNWISRCAIIVISVILLVVLGCSSHYSGALTTNLAHARHWNKRCPMHTCMEKLSDGIQRWFARLIFGPEETLPNPVTTSRA